MTKKSSAISALLSFNGGFRLQGLFTAHVTGNFVTLAATLLSGTHGVVAKLLALPEFVIVIAAARLVGAALRARGLPARQVLLTAKLVCLLAFFMLAVAFGPFPDSDAPAALWAAFAGIAGMAIQNAVQRVHFSNLPPTTLMTGNTTQAVLDGVDLLRGTPGADASAVRARLGRILWGISYFALGCALAAALYYLAGFWCLALPIAVDAGTVILREDT